MFNFSQYEWVNPEYLWMLVIIPIMIAYYLLRYRHLLVALNLPSLQKEVLRVKSPRAYLIHLLPILRMASLALVIIALARPQSTLSEEKIKKEGIDIVMAIDISSSMLAMDFQPNRLEASKKVVQDFITSRPNDRMGLVVFAGESFTQCPITIDHKVLSDLTSNIKSGMIEDGTAIGMGLATGVNRLKESEAISKVIILLTDGVNNSGFIAPATAAELAVEFNIRVYTIGVGTKGQAPYPVQTPFGQRTQQMQVRIDEALLKDIASQTGGQYFRATNNASLKEIYNEIDKLEKTKIEHSAILRHSEEFHPYLFWGLMLLGFELLLRYTVLRSFS